MRHRVSGYKLGRNTSHRKAMRRNMAIAFFTHGQITTTIPKAKSLKPMVEKIITLAKRGDEASRRRVIKQIGDPIMMKEALTESDQQGNKGAIYTRKQIKEMGYRYDRYLDLQDGPKLVKFIFDEIGPKYEEREGGYSRIIRLSQRRLGDGGQLCVLQLVGDEEGPEFSGTSVRRKKANKRMEFAAKLRKGKGANEEVAPEAEEEVVEAAVATEEAPETTEAPEASEAPAEEAAADEATEEKSE